MWRDRYAPIRTDADVPVVGRQWEYESGFRELWHAHDEGQLIYVTRGVLRVLTVDGIWTLAPFQGIWLPAAALHELHAIGEVTVRTAYVHSDATFQNGGWRSCRALRVDALLDALLVALTDGADCDASQRFDLMLALFRLELARAVPISSGTLSLPSDRRLRAICQQMLAAPDNNDTIERWSERVGASARTLARLFREETGLSFGQWRQQLRLTEAIARLALGMPVATIAAELGYQSSSAFISMFRKTLGETPQRYLRRQDVG
ncbi:AraC-type DNA-binding protein [Chitinasiproducens palmae]|uniref:AraC-type DNA-binding protein n=1 Tax=Chitinasiproducens palmae TaxID=1770053 RepID=A0A1H2PSU5_9BURK|nr:AraC-type DNA-binding protein [Chitinasiproducens palmae]